MNQDRPDPLRRGEETNILRQTHPVDPAACPLVIDQSGRSFGLLMVDGGGWFLHFARCPKCLTPVGVATDPLKEKEPIVFDAYLPPLVDTWGECGELMAHDCTGGSEIPRKLSDPNRR